MRESRSDREHSHDIAGAVTITAGLALLVYAVSEAPNHGWGSAWTISRLVVAAILLLAFLVIESRAKDPLMPFRIFRVRTVAGANVAGLFLGAIVFANFFLLTLYVQQVLHWSALKTGVTFVATAGTAILWAGIAQALVTRVGVKPVMIVGLHRADRRHDLVHADPGARLVLHPICCPATCSSASRFRSRSCPCRSPRSPASSGTRPGSRPG